MSEDDITIGQIERIVKQKKQKINVKQKGKRGESWFADKLSEITGHHFHRIYTSGASVGQSNSSLLDELTQAQAEAQLGDIQSPEDFLHYFIWESKNYIDLDFHNLINPENKFCSKIIGWIGELEYDIESAIKRMKKNYRPVAGFLCIKITRKGSWIVANRQYIENLFFKNKKMIHDNMLLFYNKPLDSLSNVGFGTEYFMTDFESYIRYNCQNLFLVDKDRKERLEKAREAFNKIYHGQ